MTSLVGGGPTATGTAGAPFGSGPFVATHGLPATDFTGTVEEVDVEEVDEVDDVVVVLLFPPKLIAPAERTTITAITKTATAPLRMPRRRCAFRARAAAAEVRYLVRASR